MAGAVLALAIGTLLIGAVALVFALKLTLRTDEPSWSLVANVNAVVMACVLVVTLATFMRWAAGGSTKAWLITAITGYVLSPMSWSASMFFSRVTLGASPPLAWLIDLALWSGIAYLTIRRVLPKVTLDIDVDRLR